jgi:branched-chain amino acid transport system permease protein
MEISWYLQIIVNGFVGSMLYVLMALGFSMIYGIMRIVNFAHGHLYMLGGLFIYGATGIFGLNFLAGMLISAISVGLVGILLERMVFTPLKNNEISAVIAGIGAAVFIGGMAEAIGGGEVGGVEPPLSGALQFGDIIVSRYRLMISGIALAVVSAFYVYFHHTKFGRGTRATVDDSEMAAVYGVNIRWVYTVNFAVAAALAAIAGCLVAPIAGASPDTALPAMFKAFIVVILGGMGSIPGAVVGGLILGYIDSTVTMLISAVMAQIIGFLVVVLVLILRPKGLLSRN